MFCQWATFELEVSQFVIHLSPCTTFLKHEWCMNRYETKKKKFEKTKEQAGPVPMLNIDYTQKNVETLARVRKDQDIQAVAREFCSTKWDVEDRFSVNTDVSCTFCTFVPRWTWMCAMCYRVIECSFKHFVEDTEHTCVAGILFFVLPMRKQKYTSRHWQRRAFYYIPDRHDFSSVDAARTYSTGTWFPRVKAYKNGQIRDK